MQAPSPTPLRREAAVVALVLAVLTVVFRYTSLDLAIAGLFFREDEGFWIKKLAVEDFMYDWGNSPSNLFFIGAFLVLIAGLFLERARRHRRASGFLVLFFAIGPGLIINLLLKPNWHRARPHTVTQFGGDWEFRRLLDPPWIDGTSFPSGHVAAAFSLIAPYFLYRGRDRGRARLWLCIGVGHGSLMAFARVSSGGHWASDALWAMGITYLVGALLAMRMGYGDGTAADAVEPEDTARPEGAVEACRRP